MPSPAPTADPKGLGSDNSRDVILATTASTQDSGLLDVLIPRFEQRTRYRVRPVAVGTGQALKMGQMGEADVLLVHAPKSEEAYMQTGAGVDRRLVMHNDFVILGPGSDPAGIKGLHDTEEALGMIATSGSLFVSRGDDSGTHKKERELWGEAGSCQSLFSTHPWATRVPRSMPERSCQPRPCSVTPLSRRVHCPDSAATPSVPRL